MNADQSKKSLIIVGIILIVIFTITGYLIGIKNNQVSKNVMVASDLKYYISSWKTYTNTKYGFELKYPDDFSILEEESEIKTRAPLHVTIKSPACESFAHNDEKEWPINCFSYTFFIQGNKIIMDGYEIRHSETKIANYPAERIEDRANAGMWGSLQQTLTQFEADGTWYIGYLSYHQSNKDMAENLLDQINSTFKFTEQLQVIEPVSVD